MSHQLIGKVSWYLAFIFHILLLALLKHCPLNLALELKFDVSTFLSCVAALLLLVR